MASLDAEHARRHWWSRRHPNTNEHPDSRKRKRQKEPSRQLGRRRLDSPRKVKRRRSRGANDVDRHWTYSSYNSSTCNDRFVIVSYNILGDDNVSKHSDLYCNISAEHLSWEKRKMRICKELKLYCPSILCFQEVDNFDDLAVLLRNDGYTGTYKGRTGCANDGCAIFWKKDRFSLLHQESIEYQKYGLRDNVAQLCLFQVSADHSNHSTSQDVNSSLAGRTLLIGNIHVLFNPNRGDIKLGQIRILLERANMISRKWDNNSVVLCGDLNSMPQSAIYRFISSSELNILMYGRKQVSGQIEFPSTLEKCTPYNDGTRAQPCMTKVLRYSWSEEEIRIAGGSRGCTLLQSPLKLSSAYAGVPGTSDTRDSNGEPLATSYHSKFMGTVDYIWHSSDLLPVRVLETLPINSLRKLKGLPSERWGSDHLALVCELAFINGTTVPIDVS
ncbi:Carbon catabolite repressor protein 4 like 5 [Apostasia shenzhenica]|uniref:Carbon catabolite repressor protein 4 like 5 n=1 Tax=Apostasia shenzhenica TaxID=1088818 RepID=A0A2I0B6U1_9ASPA|nr:Carbon catabolite repressor protein 4 like 5 [Apostasia shenzhenica]